MNILIAANYGTPASGNFIGSLIELGYYLRKKGDNLSFIFPKNKNTTSANSWVNWLTSEGFKVELIDLTLPDNKQLEILKESIYKQKADILHIHFGLFHQFATHNRSQLPVSVLVHEHMEYPVGCNHFIQSIHYVVRSAVYRLNDIAVVCVNKQVSKVMLFAKHWYLPNAVSFKRNIEHSMSREERRKELGFSDDEKIVLFLGWDVYRKGLDVAVKAINECRKYDENIKLAIVGLGTPPKEERLKFIQDSTGISPSEPWIIYLHNTEDMFSYHRAVDVYLSSSRSEAFSYGLIEAISQEKPIVISDIKDTSWASEYTRSYSYPVEDYKLCAQRIMDALNTRALQSNRDSMLQKYNIDTWIRKLYSLYGSVETHK